MGDALRFFDAGFLVLSFFGRRELKIWPILCAEAACTHTCLLRPGPYFGLGYESERSVHTAGNTSVDVWTLGLIATLPNP